MAIRTAIYDIINNENDCETDIDELKTKLRKQIKELKSIIFHTECNLGISKFANTKCIIESQTSNNTSALEIPNINLQLKSELYRYSGFYCVKYTKQECVFHLSSLNKQNKKNTFVVQILTDKGKVKVGKWLMPMPIDLHDLMSKLSINDLRDVPYFLKTCKQYADCYFIREKQFLKLMDVVSHLKNNNLQTNLDYTCINLELMGIHDKMNDDYIHIIIYLQYKINEIRPDKIKVDSKTEKTLNPQSIKYLKASLACFKQLDLHVAFKEMLNEGEFIWSKEEDEDSPIEINNSNSSDNNGFLEEHLLSKEKSIDLSRRKRKRKKKQKTLKKQMISNDFGPSTSKDTRYFNSHLQMKEKEQEPGNKGQHSESTSDSDIIESTSTANKSNQKKLKQRKLEFYKEKSKLSKKNDAALSKVALFKKRIVYRKQSQPSTSTPIHQEKQGSNLLSPRNIDISDITVNGK